MNKLGNEQARGEYLWWVRVRSAAQLDLWVKDYFTGLSLEHREDGTSILSGMLPDLSAVYGMVLQLRDAGIPLISLEAKRHLEADGGG